MASYSQFDQEIESLSSWKEMVEWISTSPTYRVVYLYCTENDMFFNNYLQKYNSISLPESERDVDYDQIRISSDSGHVLKSKSDLTEDDSLFVDDEYHPATAASCNEILRIVRKNYWRIANNKHRGSTQFRTKTMMAINTMYAWYTGDDETMRILLDAEKQMTSLMTSDGDLKYIIHREYCDKMSDVSDLIDIFFDVMPLDDKIRPEISKHMIDDISFMRRCFTTDPELATKMLNVALKNNVHVVVPADILTSIKGAYMRGGADLMLRSAETLRYVCKECPNFVEKARTTLKMK